MNKISVFMPQMGQSAAEGVIVKWHKKIGESVRADEILVEVESDKVSFEVESPATGRLAACLKEGMTVPVGNVIATIEATDGGAARPHLDLGSSAVLVASDDTDRDNLQVAESANGAEMTDLTRDWLSPAVMRVALLNNVSPAELKKIRGSGRGGRITRQDILNHLARRSSSKRPQEGDFGQLQDKDQVRPMTSIRKTIADHMVLSIHTSAHVTMVHAVDMTRVVALRDRIRSAFEARYDVRMSYTAVVIFVTARVLRQFPSINASVVGTNLVLKHDVNIGCAVALPDESLVVPVVRHADRKSFPEVARDLDRLIDLARTRALAREDIDSGTFTISNFGSFGSLMGTPIINQPQVAILGMGAIFKAPVVVQNQICIRDLTYLNLSFDHRVIDGAMGGRFLNSIQQALESIDAAALDVADLCPAP